MGKRMGASGLVAVAFCAGGVVVVSPVRAQQGAEPRADEAPLSEAEIEEKLRHDLEQDPWIAFEEGTLEVDVDDGVATVRGQAGDLLARDRVAYVADQIPGVERVVNQVVAGEAPVSDAEIARQVTNTVDALSAEGDALFTEVRDGVVSVYGSVAESARIDVLREELANVPGVRDVETHLRVEATSAPSDEALYAQIRRRLFLDPVVDVRNLTLAVRGREVLVGGVVGTVEARQRVIRAAWTEGAEDVFAEPLQVDPSFGTRPPAISDRAVAREVALELQATPWAEGADVEVGVESGRVTLRGEVPTLLARTELARAAASLPGIREVIVAIDVVPPFRAWEGAIEEAIAERLRQDPLLGGSHVVVDARRGVVRLNGDVPSAYERERIEAVVASVPGVVRIDDELRVRGNEDVSERRVARYFEQRLAQVADLEGASIRMIVTPDEIYLEGNAETERARAAAERIARDITVRPVVNQIRVG